MLYEECRKQAIADLKNYHQLKGSIKSMCTSHKEGEMVIVFCNWIVVMAVQLCQFIKNH